MFLKGGAKVPKRVPKMFLEGFLKGILKGFLKWFRRLLGFKGHRLLYGPTREALRVRVLG